MIRTRHIISGMLALFTSLSALAQTDPDFHIYICIGQSNMEGNARIEPVDMGDVDGRFRVMATVDYMKPERKIGEWYVAEPPLVRESTGLTPMDYFGRAMVERLPGNVKVGVVSVAIGGCRIEHLSKDYDTLTLSGEAEWFQDYMHFYGDYPYGRLIACARKAKEAGVIKGILLHQGESNSGDTLWCGKVKRLYEDILSDLGLPQQSIPLYAGELVSKEMGGVCGDMNCIIRSLPEKLPCVRIISSEGLPQNGDGLHFTASAYRELGRRYAESALALMGILPSVESANESERIADLDVSSE